VKARYRFELLFKHSNLTAKKTRRHLGKELREAQKIFNFLDYHFQCLEEKPRSLVINVKLLLTTRFVNSLFSALILTERGLIMDAFHCTRSALETTAFYWLICCDASAALLYDDEKSPAPVEVRKRLEAQGIDVNTIRELYSLESKIAHVGNQYDHIQIKWENYPKGKLMVGGGLNPVIQKSMLEGMIISVFRFVKFENDYIVPDLDNSK
jgi:hypothetical protein